MEIENSVLSTRLSGNYQIPIGERRLRTVVLKSSDFDLVENKNLDQFTIFSIKKSNVRTMFFTLFSCVWFLLHQIYPVLHVLLSSQPYINHKRRKYFVLSDFFAYQQRIRIIVFPFNSKLSDCPELNKRVDKNDNGKDM